MLKTVATRLFSIIPIPRQPNDVISRIDKEAALYRNKDYDAFYVIADNSVFYGTCLKTVLPTVIKLIMEDLDEKEVKKVSLYIFKNGETAEHKLKDVTNIVNPFEKKEKPVYPHPIKSVKLTFVEEMEESDDSDKENKDPLY